MNDHFTEFNENDAPAGCKAVRSSGCRGCAFNPTDDACMSANCTAHTREDGCNVHFVKKADTCSST